MNWQDWTRPLHHWSPAQQTLALFLSANLVNAGNLAFNVLFGRWLGPELFSDLALLLTIKLSLMSLFVALQIRITDYAANMDKAERDDFSQWLNNQMRLLLLITTALTVPLIAAFYQFSSALPFSSAHLLPALALCFPVMVPLCIKRGIAQGDMALKAIIGSVQAEMAVRLLGSILAWQLGFGLEGVALAIAASIFAGWYFAGTRPVTTLSIDPSKSHIKRISMGLWPWAALQLAQVLHLDSEAIAAKINLTPLIAGQIAALDLMQRIFFFACFALSAALIPLVAKAIRSNHPIWPAIKTIFLLITLCAIGFLSAMIIAPQWVVSLMFGEAFLAIAPTAWKAGLTAIIFTLTYFIATLGMTLGKRHIGYVLLLFGIGQAIFFFVISSQSTITIDRFFDLKIICQLLFCLYCLCAVLMPQRKRHAVHGL